jgi:hypothetical protein
MSSMFVETKSAVASTMTEKTVTLRAYATAQGGRFAFQMSKLPAMPLSKSPKLAR